MSLLVGGDVRISSTYWDRRNGAVTCSVSYPEGGATAVTYSVSVQMTPSDTAATLQARARKATILHSNAYKWAVSMGYQMCHTTILSSTTAKGRAIMRGDMCDSTGRIRWKIQTHEDVTESEFNTIVAQAYTDVTAPKPEDTMKAAVTALRALL